MQSIFTPEPPMETLAARIARQPRGIPFSHVPRPGHAEFVGPLRRWTMDDMYDPRENVPGRTFWGD